MPKNSNLQLYDKIDTALTDFHRWLVMLSQIWKMLRTTEDQIAFQNTLEKFLNLLSSGASNIWSLPPNNTWLCYI